MSTKPFFKLGQEQEVIQITDDEDEEIQNVNECKNTQSQQNGTKNKKRFFIATDLVDLGSNKRFHRNPRFSETQFSIDQILENKRALREKNLSGGEHSNASSEIASLLGDSSDNTRPSTPSSIRQFGRAFSPTVYSPEKLTIPTIDEIQKQTNIDINEFLRVLLSLNLGALNFEHSEEMITEHLRQHGLVTDLFKANEELPLMYDSLGHYKLSYLPLIMYDGWAQIVEGYHTNHYGRLKMYQRNCDLKEDKNFITLRLKGLVPSSDVHFDKFALENWVVIIQPPSNDGGASRSRARAPDPESANKMAIGFIQSYINKLNVYSDRDSAPEHLPVMGRYDEERSSSLTEIEYVVKVCKNENNIKLLVHQKNLSVQPVYYFRPSIRYVETLSQMNFKSGFQEAFLNPDRDTCKIDFHQPSGFTFFEEDTFNVQQKKAILGCFNAVQLPYAKNKTVMIQGPPGTGKTHTLFVIVKNMFIN